MIDPIRNPQLAELLVDRATVGLTADEQNELQRLLDSAGIADDFSFDAIVVLLQETSDPADMKPLPDHIRSKVLVDAERVVSSGDGEITDVDKFETESESRRSKNVVADRSSETTLGNLRFRRREILAWLVAAASLLIAGFLWLGTVDQNATGLISLSDQRVWDNFVAAADADDLFEVKLEKGNHGGGPRAQGTVLWNQRTKKGVIRLSGLAKNVPGKEQYQLWVIDGIRGIADRPNAGVFNISNTGVNIFEFRSDLEVFEPQGFAVTVEKRGGVSKSDLSRIALVNLGT